MTPESAPQEAYVGSEPEWTREKALSAAGLLGSNREGKRRIARDLARAESRATMPDMANDYRAKRRAKRLAANKTRNRNRRLSK